MKALGAILLIVSYVAMALAFVSGIGYGLYLLGVAGVAFGPAAWSGFVLWAKMFFGGLVGVFVGLVMTK
jgi:hypothetical protein